MDDPNADPTNLTIDRLNQARLGAMIGVILQRRPLAVAEMEGASRCPCGGPATLFSAALLASHGKMILLCDACVAKVIARV
jgi:hypothetical protein